MCFANAGLQIIFHVFAKFFECQNENLIKLLKRYGLPAIGALDATSFVRGLDIFPEFDKEAKKLQHCADEFLSHVLNEHYVKRCDTLLSTTVSTNCCSSCCESFPDSTNDYVILQLITPPKSGKLTVVELINSNAISKADVYCNSCNTDTLVRKTDWFAGEEQPALLTISMTTALFSGLKRKVIQPEDSIKAASLNKHWEGDFVLVAMVCCNVLEGPNGRHYTAVICIDLFWWKFDDKKVEKILKEDFNEYKRNATIVIYRSSSS